MLRSLRVTSIENNIHGRFTVKPRKAVVLFELFLSMARFKPKPRLLLNIYIINKMDPEKMDQFAFKFFRVH